MLLWEVIGYYGLYFFVTGHINYRKFLKHIEIRKMCIYKEVVFGFFFKNVNKITGTFFPGFILANIMVKL